MLRGAILVFLGRNFQKAVAVVITFMLARAFGREGLGVYYLLTAIPMIVSTVMTLGIGPGHVYFRGQGKLSIPQALGNSFAATALFGLSSTVIFLFASPYLPLGEVDLLPVMLVSLVFLPRSCKTTWTTCGWARTAWACSAG